MSLFFSSNRSSVQISSTCSGLSRCCFMALRSTARCTEEMETSVCCPLLWRRSSCPNWPVGRATQPQLAAENVLSGTMRTGQIRLCSCVALCVCVSVGRAGLGPHVQQSDGTSGWLHPQADERLPHCAAWRQPIHAGTVGSPVTCPNIVTRRTRKTRGQGSFDGIKHPGFCFSLRSF